MPNRLSPLDLAFVQMESPTNPVHVAGLHIYEKPVGYEGNFERDLYEIMLSKKDAQPPFNHVLRMPFLPIEFPHWEDDDNFDIEYHVRHNALPSPGGMGELMQLVARLHGRLLDRSRPLWELYVIEGVGDNKFAIYTKMHHAAIDGVAAMRLLNRSLQDSAEERPDQMVWELKRMGKPTAAVEEGVKSLAGSAADAMMKAKAVPEIYRTLIEQGLQTAGLLNKPSGSMFQAPKSVLNVKVSGARRVAAVSLPLSEIKEMGKRVEASLNDMIMLICAGALREYLGGRGELPEKPLIGSMPVSVVPDGDDRKAGNQISYVLSSLATDQNDMGKRLLTILEATRQAKTDVLELSVEGAKAMAMLGNTLTAVLKQLRLVNLAPPPANLIISNVPGPLHAKYFFGAKLLANYPISVLVDGQALNITITSYHDQLDFGMLACRDAFPDIDKLAEAIDKAWCDTRAWLSDDKAAADFLKMAHAPHLHDGSGQELVSDLAKVATRTAEYAGKTVIDGAIAGTMVAGKAIKTVGKAAGSITRRGDGSAAPQDSDDEVFTTTQTIRKRKARPVARKTAQPKRRAAAPKRKSASPRKKTPGQS